MIVKIETGPSHKECKYNVEEPTSIFRILFASTVKNILHTRPEAKLSLDCIQIQILIKTIEFHIYITDVLD